MQKICKYMHLPHEFTSIAYICQNMQKICKICKHEIYMHNMHSPLCWCGPPSLAVPGSDTGTGKRAPGLAIVTWPYTGSALPHAGASGKTRKALAYQWRIKSFRRSGHKARGPGLLRLRVGTSLRRPAEIVGQFFNLHGAVVCDQSPGTAMIIGTGRLRLQALASPSELKARAEMG